MRCGCCPAWLQLAGLLMARSLAAEVEPPVADADMPRVPATAPDAAAATFEVRPGFRADLVASEPLVVDPVAMAFDSAGRLYVVEMRDYSERRPERLGRVRRLEDTDGDGRMDRSVVYLDGLPWPTAVTCWRDGIFVGSTPDVIYARDTDGDGRADIRETVFTGFASEYAPYATNRLNVQALMNSLQWGPDQRIHGATSMSGGRVRRVDSPFVRGWLREAGVEAGAGEGLVDLRGRDFSFDPWRLELRAETGGGQHGMTFGPEGDKFVCSNSDHLQWIRLDEPGLPANPWHEAPAARVGIAVDGPAAPVFRRSPDEPWRVLRTRWRAAGLVPGPVEGGGRPSGYFTGATGVTVYRGDAYGAEFEGNAFVADCGSNLIHRKSLRPGPDGVQPLGERVADERDREFLASTDTWFRPVQFINAPDGCLWVADMYREVIEHPWSLPASLKGRLDLNSGNDRGRIWRLAPVGWQAGTDRTAWTREGLEGWVRRLGHPDGWHRDTAGRLLVESRDPSAPAMLRRAVRGAPTPSGRAGALSVLAALRTVGPGDLLAALGDAAPAVRRRALGVLRTGTAPTGDPAVVAAVRRLAETETDERVRLELIQTAAHLPVADRPGVLGPLLRSRAGWLRSLAVHAAGEATPALVRWTREAGARAVPMETWTELGSVVGRSGDAAAVAGFAAECDPAADPDRALASALALRDGLLRGGQVKLAATVVADLAAVTAVARDAVANPSAGEARAASAMGWLAAVDPGAVQPLIPAWLAGGRPARVEAALSAVAVAGPGTPDAWEAWLSGWSRYPAAARQRLAGLARRRGEGVAALLTAVETGSIRVADLPATELQALRELPEAAVRARARRALGEPAASRAGVVAAFLPALGSQGDPTEGRRIFRERCASCHARDGEGVAVGPDLASVAANGPEKLLVAVLDPNREVAPAFAAWRIETADGETFEGLRVGESAAGIRLRQAGGTEISIDPGRVRRFDSTGRSLMPEGLEEGLDPQSMASLLAWLSPPAGGSGR